MNQSHQEIHFRKFTDINRENPLFELVDGEIVLLDIGLSDAGVLEVAFHEAISNRVFKAEELSNFLDEGKRLVASS